MFIYIYIYEYTHIRNTMYTGTVLQPFISIGGGGGSLIAYSCACVATTLLMAGIVFGGGLRSLI